MSRDGFLFFLIICILILRGKTNGVPIESTDLNSAKTLQTYIIPSTNNSVSSDGLINPPMIPVNVEIANNTINITSPDGNQPPIQLEVQQTYSNGQYYPQQTINQDGTQNYPQQTINQERSPYYSQQNYGPYYASGYQYPQYIPQAWIPYLTQANPNHPVAYAPVQTEFEGILVPVKTQSHTPTTKLQSTTNSNAQKDQSNVQISERGPFGSPAPAPVASAPAQITMDVIISALRFLLPPNWISLFVNWASLIMNIFSVITLGGLITTGICSLTPLCTITFGGLPLSAGMRKSLGIDSNSTDTLSTTQRVRRAAQLFDSALQKYEELERFKTLQELSKRNGKGKSKGKK